jgi:hypothetical protein
MLDFLLDRIDRKVLQIILVSILMASISVAVEAGGL